MQIAALNPRFWDKSLVTDDVLAEEKKILVAQMDNDPKMASKPAAGQGKDCSRQDQQVLRRELPAAAAVRQGRLMSPSSSTWLPPPRSLAARSSSSTLVRFEKGEGIEKKQEDFAAEVAAQMNMGK